MNLILFFRDVDDLEYVLENEEETVSLCCASANAALSRASATLNKSLAFSSSKNFSKSFKLRLRRSSACRAKSFLV